ncbi:MAG: copper resistance protein CopC/CopD [Chloroflexi bacterium]|nr:copper resistance protein CopC/CopD [Chloroflexota bacterium]
MFRRRLSAVTLAGVSALLLIGVWLVGTALAHADLARGGPAPGSALKLAPERVAVWFTDPVEIDFSGIRVLDARGGQVDNRDSARYQNDPAAVSVTLPGLPDGTYTVAWWNLSAVDGHTNLGSYVFAVGEPTAGAPQRGAVRGAVATQPLLQSLLEPPLRWLALLSILGIIGALSFELLISGPVLAARGASKVFQHMEEQMSVGTLKLTWLASGLFLLASLGELAVKASIAKGVPLFLALGSPMIAVVRQTGWGDLWLWRTNLLLGTIAVLMLASLGRRRGGSANWREGQVVALAFAAGILLTLTLASHGAAVPQIRIPALFSYFLHLLGAGVWVGGLLYLALVVPPAMRLQRQQSGRATSPGVFCPAVHVVAMSRFSALATLSVGILFVTGLYSSWAQVTILPALATPYGATLLTKLGLIAPLLLFGAVNLFWARPRLAADGKALRFLHRTVAAQAILAVLVLLSVGLLVSLEPARRVAARQGIGQQNAVTLKGAVEGAEITVDVEPNRVGRNRFVVSLKDRTGRPLRATQVNLLLTYQKSDVAANWQSAAPAGEGQYVLERSLNLAGPWQLEVTVQRPDAFDARASFRFEVLPAASYSALAPTAEAGNVLWAAELVLIGLLMVLAWWMMRRFERGRGKGGG